MNQRSRLSALAAAAVLAAATAYAAVPVVTAFVVAPSSLSPVPVTTFTATDSDGTVTGYLITTTSTKPTATAPGWTSTPPTSYAAAIGSRTLYAWAKDNANGVSNSRTATTNVEGAHTHSQADVAGLAGALAAKADTTTVNQALAGKSDVGHTHSVYQKYAQVVTVATSGGDFTDPAEAVNSIVDASAARPYLVKVMPGVYDLTSRQLLMRSFVDVEGAGKNVTKITGVGATNSGVLVGAANSVLKNLTVESTGPGAAIDNPSRLEGVSVLSYDPLGFAINMGSNTPRYLKDVDITAQGPCIWDQTNGDTTIDNAIFDGADAGIKAGGGSWTIRHVTALGWDGIIIAQAEQVVIDDALITVQNVGLSLWSWPRPILPRASISNSRVIGAMALDLGRVIVQVNDSSFTASGGVAIDVREGVEAQFFGVQAKTDTVPVMRIRNGSIAGLYGGRYVGDVWVDSAAGVLNAAGVQFEGNLPSAGTNTFLNCFTGAFVGIPNQSP